MSWWLEKAAAQPRRPQRHVGATFDPPAALQCVSPSCPPHPWPQLRGAGGPLGQHRL